MRTGLLVAVIAAALAVGAALVLPGGAERREEVAADGATRSSASSPFAVGWVPEGFEPFVAGRGSAVQLWGEDSFGTDEPFTVLGPSGGGRATDELVVVSVTGYAGYQGGLAQAAAGYGDDPEWFIVEGREALFTEVVEDRSGPAGDPSEEDEVLSEVVVAREDDLAVRVVGRGSRSDLAAVASGVRPEGRGGAPDVDAPEGMTVVGRSGADLVLALQAAAQPGQDAVPGPASAHGAGWERRGSTLAVLTVPGVAGDLGALTAPRRFEAGSPVQELTVGGRQAILLELGHSDCEPSPCEPYARVVISTTGAGDLSVVRASGEVPLPTVEELVQVSESVRSVDAAAWDAFVVEASGGPGLHPDRGDAEVARGVQGTTEWLLQTTPVATDGSLEPGPVGGEDVGADPCLKTSAGRRVCADSSAIGAAAWGTLHSSQPEPDPALPGFVVLTSTVEAAAFRVTAGDQVATAPLVRVPGTVPRWSGVAFVERPGFLICGPPPADTPLDVMRVELVDTSGATLRCLG